MIQTQIWYGALSWEFRHPKGEPFEYKSQWVFGQLSVANCFSNLKPLIGFGFDRLVEKMSFLFQEVEIIKNNYPPGNGYISHRKGSSENHHLQK